MSKIPGGYATLCKYVPWARSWFTTPGGQRDTPARQKRLQPVRKDLASHTSHNHTAHLKPPDFACQISHFTIPASQEKTPASQEKISASQQTFPETTHLTPHTSHPRPHISHLTPHSLDLTPGCLESLADWLQFFLTGWSLFLAG